MKEIVNMVKFIIGFGAFLLIIGSIGALEQESMGYTQCIIQSVIGYAILAIELKTANR